MDLTRRNFIKAMAASAAGLAVFRGSPGWSAKSYGKILGANDRVRVGIVGFSDRAKDALIPCFWDHSAELNFEIVAVSDIWNRRREEGLAFVSQKTGQAVNAARNNEELYEKHRPDAVIISTADFQHALHTVEAVQAGCDVYVEKPFAETMADNRLALQVVKQSDRIVQVGSQRRSGANYIAANQYIKSGKFGPITFVEMTWNVNQPGRWRRPHLVAAIKETDTDWKRYLMNRPYEPWDPRKYIEYRLFWPYSSGIPGQWMCHQIDTVHWFTDLPYPRSVVAGGGIYVWKDGRKNCDTLTAVFDYGPLDDPSTGFQVVYSSRMHNSAGGVKEYYFSNGGKLDLDRNLVTNEGGLTERDAAAIGMPANLLEQFQLPETKVVTSAATGTDPMTSAHMRNWMECVRSRKQPNADVVAGYHHSIATIMTNAALRTGQQATFDAKNQEVLAGGKPFQY
ncbi:MAG: Gfo/Idh/MocA family oxidoreductase [candidate division KSB1 bacterium]|nr:Gfo/Idh/MocA family oxidoreductase [candidate division KSB1 bacterium]